MVRAGIMNYFHFALFALSAPIKKMVYYVQGDADENESQNKYVSRHFHSHDKLPELVGSPFSIPVIIQTLKFISGEKKTVFAMGTVCDDCELARELYELIDGSMRYLRWSVRLKT